MSSKIAGFWPKPDLYCEGMSCVTYDCPICFEQKNLQDYDRVCEQCCKIVCEDCLDSMNSEQFFTCPLCRFVDQRYSQLYMTEQYSQSDEDVNEELESELEILRLEFETINFEWVLFKQFIRSQQNVPLHISLRVLEFERFEERWSQNWEYALQIGMSTDEIIETMRRFDRQVPSVSLFRE